jgi:uncharacterized protein
MRYLRLLIVAAVVAAGPVLADALDDGTAAYEGQEYATALRLFRPLATKGDAVAQFSLGLVYDKGQGVPQDDRQAYFWLLLASVGGNAAVVSNRDLMEKRLTPTQRAAAQADARNWKPRQP